MIMDGMDREGMDMEGMDMEGMDRKGMVMGFGENIHPRKVKQLSSPVQECIAQL